MPGLRRRCRSNQAPDTGPASNRQHHPQRLRNPAAPPQPRAATPASEIPRGPSDQELCTPRKGRRLLASFRSRWEEAEAGRGRRRRRMGAATWSRRERGRRGEER